MAQVTVNQALVVQKSIRARISELTALRSEVSTKETYYGGGNTTKTVEPQYDVKEVDKKIAGLENMLFKIDAAIKASNAEIKIEVPGLEIDSIFEPIK